MRINPLLKLSQNPLETRVTTRDGREARIFDVLPEQNQIFAKIKGCVTPKWYMIATDMDGKCSHEENVSLINAPEPEVVLWVNVYRSEIGLIPGPCFHETKEAAEAQQMRFTNPYVGAQEIRFRPAKGEK